MSRETVELRVDDFLRSTADERLHDPATAEPRLPLPLDLRRHSRHAAKRFAHNQRFFLRGWPGRAGRFQTNIAIATDRSLGFPKVTEDGQLPAFARIRETHHQFQL